MVPSAAAEEGSSSLNKTARCLNHRGSPSSSKSISSTSSSSSASPFSTSCLGHRTSRTTKTMEEVWKDINLASLQDQETASNNNVILQDFLARPFSKDPPPARIVSTTAAAAVYCPPPGSLAPPPATVLSLNSGCEFHFLDQSDPLRPNSHLQSNVTSFSSPFEALASSTGLASFGKKRVPESDGSSGDRRHKRMIKNRESAARSRARKQECAYTNELELEVAHLMEENARLRKQQEQLRLAAAAQLPKKNSLHRTSTAPF
ncbi:protein FD [Corylus avellana]|uniref:protein FD n=1 Tax=Corylus avellana TaxID=13451 RepID=UPI001E215AC4|nr:protein FD [Corylus avellana]